MKHVSRRIFTITLVTVVTVGICSLGAARTSGSAAAQGSGPGGDIPDTATYLVYHGPGYSLKYVEGWTLRRMPAGGVRISDKDSSESVQLASARGGTIGTFAAADLSHLARSAPRFQLVSKATARLSAGPSVYAQYHTLSSPDPVTGKRVPVLVDRYYIQGKAKRAVLTLSTPVRVDNVDAFRLIARSFRWT